MASVIYSIESTEPLCGRKGHSNKKIDQIKKECNKELKQWKSTVVKQWQNKGKFTVVLLKAL